ncbi:four helix bundle protein [Candidatus Saccharibacteria bacterium]|nr:four helix bundle protein [Candidatus Saccharibacteria bacterium]
MSPEPLKLDVRTVNFSREVITFCKAEKVTLVSRPLINQLVRSATSIGANYAEANNAASRVDFRSKIFIAKKETAETEYWLTLLSDVTNDKDTCNKLTQECHYLLMTFQKIINTLNKGKTAKV